MEIKIREKLHFRNVMGIIKNIKDVFSKIPKFHLKIYEGVVEGYLYTISREDKVQALEAELKKAQALAEAHRRRMQIL